MLSVELGLRHKGIEFFTLLLAFLSAADFQFFTLHLHRSQLMQEYCQYCQWADKPYKE